MSDLVWLPQFFWLGSHSGTYGKNRLLYRVACM